MTTGPRLELRQSQSLVMTPQLQQAIKLLQLSSNDLVQYVEAELENNPILERGEDGSSFQSPSTTDNIGDGSSSLDNPNTTQDQDFSKENAQSSLDQGIIIHENDSPLDADYRNEFDGDIAGPGGESHEAGASLSLSHIKSVNHNNNSSTPANLIENSLSDTPTLKDHLEEQMKFEVHDIQDRIIALHLIDLVDEAGYLIADLTKLAKDLGTNLSQVEKVLFKLQNFDPPGIFARSLSECLALQLKDRNRFDPVIAKLLDNLSLLASQDVRGLKKICQVDDQELAEMVLEIRALDPKPGLRFSHEIVQPVIPDILMHQRQNGEWAIELNPETLPKVLVNESYYSEVSEILRSKKERDYISERFQSANWLVKCLHQRATTIMKVGREIIRQQDAFFRFGVSFLKPLVLRDIAMAIDMHESTISRVTNNKYISTPMGLFELKYFFTSSVGSTLGGGSHSAESVKHHIKTLTDDESPKKILSDDKIVEILKKQGIDIARRTVAKYREAMHIPSSVQRRRNKNRKI